MNPTFRPIHILPNDRPLHDLLPFPGREMAKTPRVRRVSALRNGKFACRGTRPGGFALTPDYPARDKRAMHKVTLEKHFAPPPTGRLIRNICVYCGSSPGLDPIYLEAARAFGVELAAAKIGLVYGGGGTGLMGALARAVLDHGGFVTGIIPEFLTEREAMFDAAQNLLVVPDMHTRKRLMFEKADAFVALPGGIGTLEELVEQLTWVQLGRHTKPVVLANIGGFWRPLLALFAHMRERRFIEPALEVRYLVAERVEEILPMIEAAAARTAAAGREKESVDPRL
jgi:uncharacterized protein (TIGR00730 family)